MYILVITLISTIGVSHPVILKGEKNPYETYNDCVIAGEHVKEWLTQDFVKATYDCMLQEEP